MSDIEDQKYGLAGNEQAAGYESMPLALVVEKPDDIPANSTMTEDQLRHFKRPEPEPPLERDFFDVQTGERRPGRETVSPENAADSLAYTREQERVAREQQNQDDLRSALDQTERSSPPAQSGEQPQPDLDQPQPELSEAERDAARAQVNAAWADADQKITEMLADPIVRERIQGELTQIQTQAKAEVDGAWQQVEQAKAGYIQHANALTGQLNALLLSNFPELQSVANDPQRLAGAVELLKQTNPQRAQALADFALRTSTLTSQLEQQGNAHRQAQAAQQEQALDQYGQAEVKRFEYWTAREVGDMKAVRENLQPLLQKHYGIDANQLKAIHDGKVQVDGARLLRSAEFQAVLTDAIRYRLAAQGVRNAVVRPVAQVQRPGVSESGPKVYDGDLAAAASRFNLPGGNEGTQGLRNAAAWVTAKRGAR